MRLILNLLFKINAIYFYLKILKIPMFLKYVNFTSYVYLKKVIIKNVWHVLVQPFFSWILSLFPSSFLPL